MSAAAALQLAYMAVAVGAAVLIYRSPLFDLRSLRRRAGVDEDARATPLDLMERADLSALLNLLVIVGAGLALLIGWRIPAEIERIYGGGASFGLLFPSVDMTMTGRLAQVVGAVAFGLIALRLLRILVLFAAAGMAGFAGLGALDYVLELGWILG